MLYYIDLSTQPITKIQVAFDADNNGILFKKFGVQVTRYSGYFQVKYQIKLNFFYEFIKNVNFLR